MSENKFVLPVGNLGKYFQRRCRSCFDKGQGLFVWSDLIKSHCYGQYTLVLIFLIKRSFWFSFNSRSMACVPISPLARMSVCNSPACSTNRKLRLANPAFSLVELSHSHSQLSWSFSQVSGANAPIPAYPAITNYPQQSCADFKVYLFWFFKCICLISYMYLSWLGNMLLDYPNWTNPNWTNPNLTNPNWTNPQLD